MVIQSHLRGSDSESSVRRSFDGDSKSSARK